MRTQTVGQGLGKQVARERHRREWTQRQLAERIREHAPDSTLGRGAVAKIETGERKVSVDEWLLLAAALNVPPPLLLLPLGSEEVVEVTPRSRIHPHLALDWVAGDEALPSSDRKVIRRGEWLKGAEPLRLYRQLREIQEDQLHPTDIVRIRARDRGDEPSREEREDRAKAVEALHAHLRRMQAAGVRPPGQTPEMLGEMVALGLDVDDLPAWDPPAEEGE